LTLLLVMYIKLGIQMFELQMFEMTALIDTTLLWL